MNMKIRGNDKDGYSGKITAIPGKDVTIFECPFCGSTEVEIWNTHSPSYSVRCLNCGAEVPSDDDICPGGLIKNKEEAIMLHEKAVRSAVENWNKRAE